MADDAVEDFVEAARRFCSAAKAGAALPDSMVERLSTTLVGVYAAALRLPDPQAATDELLKGPPRPTISPIVEPLRAALGEDDTFTTIFDPTEPDNSYKSSLAQELGEIYEDLEEALALLNEYGQTADCLWQVKFDFEEHWGQHAMHVLPALHQLRRFR